MFIWLVSLYLGWEKFRWLQVIGFIVLIYGTFLFNDIIYPPFCFKVPIPEEIVNGSSNGNNDHNSREEIREP